MAALHIAVIAFHAISLLGGGFCVSDEEFHIHQSSVAKMIGEMKSELQDMSEMLKTQEWEISRQATVIRQQDEVISRLETDRKCTPEVLETDNLQNATIEERVSLLEIQVVEIQEDVTDTDERVTLVEGNVSFLFDEQVIQDERLLTLEQTTDSINADLVTVDDELQGLQATTLALDFRVTILEENGGSDGNSSIAELEVRLETLEGTAADHETRLTIAETDIEGLQATDMNHDVRISALEENVGGSQNDTIAFHSLLTSYETIPDESAVIFNEVVLNQGEGYDSSNGVFTVPTGGNGVYYFSTNLYVEDGEYGAFDMRLNDDVICTTRPDHANSGGSDYASGSCSAVVDVVAGDEVQVVLRSYSDDTPLYVDSSYRLNGFNGFRI